MMRTQHSTITFTSPLLFILVFAGLLLTSSAFAAGDDPKDAQPATKQANAAVLTELNDRST